MLIDDGNYPLVLNYVALIKYLVTVQKYLYMVKLNNVMTVRYNGYAWFLLVINSCPNNERLKDQ